MFYALNSVDHSSRAAMREAMTSLAALGAFALGLALVGSFALARLLTEPIGKLSTSLAATAASRNVSTPVPLAGSSHEVDAFTEAFNALMKSVAQAQAQTEEATPARFAPSRPRSTRAIRTRLATQSASACCRWRAVA